MSVSMSIGMSMSLSMSMRLDKTGMRQTSKIGDGMRV